jgi:hypothetical protein
MRMAVSLTDEELIAQHVYFAPGRTTPELARLVEQAVPIWIIIDYDGAVNGDTEQVAATYAISCEAVAAARAHYRKYREYIDAKILLNRAYFERDPR